MEVVLTFRFITSYGAKAYFGCIPTAPPQLGSKPPGLLVANPPDCFHGEE
jgi:hypothetical protein